MIRKAAKGIKRMLSPKKKRPTKRKTKKQPRTKAGRFKRG